MASVGEVNLQQILSQCCRLINLWTNDCDALRMVKKSTDLLEMWKVGRDAASSHDITDSTVCRMLDSLELVLDGNILPAPCQRTTCHECKQSQLYQLDEQRDTLLEWFGLTVILKWQNRATRLVEVCCRYLRNYIFSGTLPWLLHIISLYTSADHKHRKDIINDVICAGSYRTLIEQYCQHSDVPARKAAVKIMQHVALVRAPPSTNDETVDSPV